MAKSPNEILIKSKRVDYLEHLFDEKLKERDFSVFESDIQITIQLSVCPVEDNIPYRSFELQELTKRFLAAGWCGVQVKLSCNKILVIMELTKLK